jgi:transposase
MSRRGVEASVRTVQRIVAPQRRAARVSDLATVRFETAPGQQLQIDFGQKRVEIAGQLVRVHLLVAVLSYSRRLFVQAFLTERGDDWREGLAGAFRHFGGVPRTVLGDNARALVVGRDRVAQTVLFHPAYLAFCQDWDVEPRACAPYRARTKGKGESGVKYVKHNALAGRGFASFAALEQHLTAWMVEADERQHGTTHEKPIARFESAERAALRGLPSHPLAVRTQRLRRRVAADALIDAGTVRYSVPHGLVRETVDVEMGETEVRIYHDLDLVARHARSREPFARVIDPAHYAGLWRQSAAPPIGTPIAPSPLVDLGRSLEAYAAAVEADAAW